MSKKNPSSDMIKPSQITGLMRDEARMNAPNVHSAYGSSTTTFGPDGQPTIDSQFSEPLQGIFDQQIAFLGGGPQQVTPYSNSGLDSLFGGFIDRMNQRNGGNAQAQLSAPPQAQPVLTKPMPYNPEPAPTAPTGPNAPGQGRPMPDAGSYGGGYGGPMAQNPFDQFRINEINRLFGGR